MTPEAMEQTFAKIPQGLMALETGTHSPVGQRAAPDTSVLPISPRGDWTLPVS